MSHRGFVRGRVEACLTFTSAVASVAQESVDLANAGPAAKETIPSDTGLGSDNPRSALGLGAKARKWDARSGNSSHPDHSPFDNNSSIGQRESLDRASPIERTDRPEETQDPARSPRR